MNDNPLVKEIRKHRDAILASHDGDYLSMMEAMRKNQWDSGHEIVSPPLKTKDKKSKGGSPPPRKSSTKTSCPAPPIPSLS